MSEIVMVRVIRVDGVEYEIGVNAGSFAEGKAALDQIADEAGAAPATGH